MQLGPGNYIVVDWEKGATVDLKSMNYRVVAANSQVVGAQLAKLLDRLWYAVQNNYRYSATCMICFPGRGLQYSTVDNIP